MGGSAALGPIVRLEGISISQLPPGGKGAQPKNPISSTEKFRDGSGSTPALSLRQFITNALSESIPFIDGVAPKSGEAATWKIKGSPKIYPVSEAPVQLFERTVSGSDLDKVEGMSQFSADRKDETWYCRRSCHRNEAEKRTASWEEFVHSFKENHPETEEAFTAPCIGMREAIRWDAGDIDIAIHGETWTSISAIVLEMKFRIDPKPLQNRTFPVMQITAALAGAQEFLVISTPINDFEKSPYSEFARDKSLVVAAYTAIERIRVLPSGDVEWIMATASDAKGVLPQWMQNLAVPSAVAKDVQMFLQWILNQRKGGSKPPAGTKLEQKNTSAAPGASGKELLPVTKFRTSHSSQEQIFQIRTP